MKYGYEWLIIDKGEYEIEAVLKWQNNTACIKDVFHDLMGNNRPGKSRLCIEWYQSDDKMLCMIRKVT